MNSGLKQVVGQIFSSFIQIQFIPVRYRYYAEKIARGPYSKKFGYNEKIFERGPLGRIDDDCRIKLPIYRPKNFWSPEKVAHGQNDYIDILGGRKLTPTEVTYDVPKWLRGRKGNEMKLLIFKQKIFRNTRYDYENPTQMSNMSRRIKYLYNYLNRRTKTPLSRS